MMKILNLKCEYLTNPMGIDITTPRLFWNLEGLVKQTAYQIVCTDFDGNFLYDTGKVASNQMTHIPYLGKELKSRDVVIWKVKVWNELDEESEYSEKATFEIGLLNQSDWLAKWITGDYNPSKRTRYPVDYFKKCFTLTTKKIKKARLYISSCGVYKAIINGNKVGNFYLAPGITDYRKRVQYQVYDILEYLTIDNEINLELADGWYRGSLGAWGMRCYYGKQTKIIAQLEVEYFDNTVDFITTDNTWKWSNDGSIIFADNKDGEIVDAIKVPSFFGSSKVTHHKGLLASSNNVEVVEQERFIPKLVTTPKKVKVLDFGQNIAGIIEFKINAHEGQKVLLRFGEMLDADGEFTQKNIQCSSKYKTTPLQQITYFCKEGVNEYKTSFSIFGFQYALIETDVTFDVNDFTAISISSDIKSTLEFTSSNDLLNKLVDCTLWSAKNNSVDLPTDCPTRERHGWSGDAQIFFTTASYLLDYASFARKYERDLCDWQNKKGAFPQIAPEGGTDFYMRVMNGSVGWADAGVLIPYRYWKIYQDEKIIIDNYDAMKKYALFMIKRIGKTGILPSRIKLSRKDKKNIVNAGQCFGEWAEPTDVHKMSWTDLAFSNPEVSTAYTSYIMSIMEEIALYLHKEEDAILYKEMKNKTKYGYQLLRHSEGYELDTDRQARLVRPLYFDLLEEKDKEYTQKRLIMALENYHWRLGTGFLSTPLILYVLSEYNLEASYCLLENEDLPGWLFMPKSGANTIWESWEGTKAQGGIASLDHYSKGACLEWIFKVMCGINVDGTNHFLISPRPGGKFSFARTSYQSIFGKVICGFKKVGNEYKYEITIPANCTAKVILPNKKEINIESGNYTF